MRSHSGESPGRGIAGVNVGPQFIHLDIAGIDVLDVSVKNVLRLRRCRQHERKNRVLVQSRKPRLAGWETRQSGLKFKPERRLWRYVKLKK